MYVSLFLLVGIEAVGVVSEEQLLIAVPKVDIGPNNSPPNLPPAVIVYVTPQFSPPIVTVAIELLTEPVSKMIHCMYITVRFLILHIHKPIKYMYQILLRICPLNINLTGTEDMYQK